LLLEAATGFGKSLTAIRLINWIAGSVYKSHRPKMLLLVAKRVHKQTWKDEFLKWGGINCDVVMECYESLHKHTGEYFEFICMDEAHHMGSDLRMEALKTLKYGYMIGLSATIPKKLKMWFKYHYHSEIVSCDITEAIDSDVLPEPTILLFPLQVENTRLSETIEVNPKASGPVYTGEYKDYWKFKKAKQRAILRCTQKQKLMELDRLIEWYKKKAVMGNQAMKQTWLYFCGKRLEFLADCKLQWVKIILHHLDKERTITFCKTIAQTEELGKNCIHSQNKDADKIYNDFNAGKIDHITAVNILNENANLVNCKYAVFANLSSSEICMPQRLGRSLRHKSPIIIMPYYKGTREEEILEKYLEGFNKDYIKTIHSISEI
jgi:superfamily II DNA or RNA helicase